MGVPMAEPADRLSQPVLPGSAFSHLRIGPLTLRNRFIKAGANEGMTPQGMPTKALVKHHRDVAAGGVGMTTVAYGAVSPEGRTFTHQVHMDQAVVPHLRALTDAVHAEGAAACLQITHGGSFTMLRPEKGLPKSASGGFNAFGCLQGILWKSAMNIGDMDRIAGEFARAAKFAREAGFDAVEIHMGHGYLLNQFLSPLTNKRKDTYGGDAVGRSLFPAQVLRRVKDAVGKHMAVTCKINQTDAAKGGIDSQQASITAQILQGEGADLLTLSGGHNMFSPWALFGSPMPLAEMRAQAKGLSRIGPWVLSLQQPKDLKFRELYFLETAKVIRQAVTMPLALVGGVKSKGAVDRVMQEGFDAIALARVLIHDPHFVQKIMSNPRYLSGCDSCNNCVMGIYAPHGVRCVYNPLNDPILVTHLAGE